MIDLSSYAIQVPDWRVQIKRNQVRTRFVIIFFIMLYLALGFFCDLLLYANYAEPLSDTFYQLIHFQYPPFWTFITLGVALVSLLITFKLHDKIVMMGMNYHEVTGESSAPEEKRIYNVVEELKIAAGLEFMPRVFIIEADYMNAFASGYSEKSALMAITRGLLQKLDRAELQAVMAHEMSHIRHLDIKVTMTAAILSNLILMVIDILFRGVLYGGRDKGGRDKGNPLFAVIIILRIVLPIITGIMLLYLSRTREYMADAGCVEITRDNMPLARALLKIHNDHGQNKEDYKSTYAHDAAENIRRQAYFYNPMKHNMMRLDSLNDIFSTHPSLEKRLAALGIQEKDL